LCAIVDKTLGTEVLRAPEFTVFFYGDLIKWQGVGMAPRKFIFSHQAYQVMDISDI
jgi:hypothetical protein